MESHGTLISLLIPVFLSNSRRIRLIRIEFALNSRNSRQIRVKFVSNSRRIRIKFELKPVQF